MEMTLEQYIGNPMAKSALLNATAREAMRNDFVKKYNAILVREHGKIDYTLFRNEKKNRYYAWFKIPSETVEKFYYDVVIEFYSNEDVEEAGKNLFKYNCKFFSNDPSFVYTYAHVFRNNDLFIEELRSKMSRKALRNAPEEKNPYNQVGYVKTIYFAYLTMVNKNLNNTDFFINNSSKISISSIAGSIMNADDKISSRQEAGEKLRKNKRKSESEKAAKGEGNTTKTTTNSNFTNTIASTKTVNKVKTVKKTKKK